MKISKYVTSSFLLFLIVIFFVIKWPVLFLHFFWDEAWVYGPAVRHFVGHGPSLLPSSMPEYISRGHPLLFHFLYSLPSYFFNSQAAFGFHLTALCISAIIFYGFYKVTRYFFDFKISILTTVFLVSSGVIFVQSGLVLPEILLAGFLFFAAFFYAIKWHIWFVIFGSLALLTKETGIVLPISLGIYEAYYLVVNKFDKQLVKKSIKNIGLISLTCVPFGIFLIIQKIQLGYFFFPDHVSLMSFSWNYFKETFIYIYDFVFEGQGRYWVSYLFYFSMCFFIGKDWKTKFLLAFLGFVMLKIFFGYWKLPVWLTLSVMPFLFLGVFYFGITKISSQLYVNSQSRITLKERNYQRFLEIAFIFLVCYFLFSAVNFYTYRYSITSIFFYSFFVATVSSLFFKNEVLKYAILLFFIGNLWYFNSKECSGFDISQGMFDALTVQEKAHNYIIENKLSKRSFYGNFTNEVAFKQALGYTTPDEMRITDINRFDLQNKEYFIQSNFDEVLNFDTIPGKFDTIKSFKEGCAEIYLLQPIK